MNDISERAAHTGETEIRSVALEDFEFRSDAEDTVTFEGVACVVDSPYVVRDAFGEFEETIRAGAFTKTLKDGNADVALFVNHQHNAIPLATRGDGSLVLSVDPDLRVVATLNPRRNDVQDVRVAVEDGQLRQMSIGMQVPKARQTWSDDYSKRSVHELILKETSIVWQGCNTLTTTSVRSLDQLIAELPADLDPGELRRAISHLEGLLPAEEEREVSVDYLAELQDLWAKRLAA